MIKSQKNNDLPMQIAVSCLLFLATLNIYNKMVYMIFAAFLVLLTFKKVDTEIDLTAIILILFSFTLILFSDGSGIFKNGIFAAIRNFMYPLTYIIGYNICSKEDSENKFQNIMIFVGLGSFFHYVLNMFINTEAEGRNTKDIWSANVVSATCQAALCCIAIGIFGAVLYSKRKPIYKILAIAGLISILVYNLVLAGRTSVALMLIVLVAGFGYYSVLNKIRRLKTILPIFFAAFFIVLAIRFNWFGIGDYVFESNLFERFTEETTINSSSGRTDFKFEYLKYILIYPFGGGKIYNEVGRYAHDLLLDLYSDAGIIAAIIILVILIISLKNIFKVFKNKNISTDMKMLVFCVYIVIYIQFFLEPIMAGMPWLLALFLFYNGMISRRLEPTEKELQI
jgi:hypothetical protein